MRAPAGSGDPPSADLFSIDAKSGLWKPEGTATNAGGSWRAEIPHLSWWNIDRFLKVPSGEQCCVRFRSRTSTGQPRSGVLVVVRPPFSATGTTDANGVLCEARFPCGVTLQVSFGVYLNESAETFVEGTITVTPNVRGSCSGQCQDVDLDTRCTEDRHCGSGQSCRMGECAGPTGGGGPTGARASCIDSRGILCVEFRGSGYNLTQVQQECQQQSGTYSTSACPKAERGGPLPLQRRNGRRGRLALLLPDAAGRCPAGVPGRWRSVAAGLATGGNVKRAVTAAGWVLPLMLAGPAAYAQTVSDAVWAALKDRHVVVQKLDGSDVIGKLIGFDATSVVVAKPDGQVVPVPRKDVKAVRADFESSPAPSSLAPTSASVASPAAGPPQSGVGLLLRPVFCLSKCEGTTFTFGPEVAGKYGAFALRYGRKDGANLVFPDLRIHYEAQLIPKLTILPFFEIFPSYAGGGGAHVFELILRPGVRLGFSPMPALLLFFEPLALDLAFFRYASTPRGDATNTDFVVRYSLGFGAQYRY